jgi:hypothetical protein
MDGIGIMLQFAINVNTLVANLHFVAPDRNDAFDEVLAGVLGKSENNHITAPRFLDGDKGIVGEGSFYTVDKFIDQNIVSDQQGVLHGTGWYFKRLHHECANKHRQDNGDDNGLDIVAQFALRWFGRGGWPV